MAEAESEVTPSLLDWGRRSLMRKVRKKTSQNNSICPFQKVEIKGFLFQLEATLPSSLIENGFMFFWICSFELQVVRCQETQLSGSTRTVKKVNMDRWM